MDFISDFVSRVNIASSKGALLVEVRKSSIIFSLLTSLESTFLIRGFKENKNTYSVFLKYSKGFPVIRELTRISKRSKRVYAGKGGVGNSFYKDRFYLLSTSTGIIVKSGFDMVQQGGEVILKVN